MDIHTHTLNQSPASMLNIPTVTEDDLRAFHQKHFPEAPAPSSFVWTAEQSSDAEEDDDLGYYPDGVKRTLTDEQIKIFRHSEIQQLLHERRLEREQEVSESIKSDDDDGPSTLHNTLRASASIVKRPNEVPTIGRVQQSSQQTKKKKKKNKKRKRSLEPVETEDTTHRREAREADDQKNVVVELDY
ncbi:hypothetical protein M501DRAFT_987551 [Patellaria atrata CBS 101060]|uniref:Uncharacterized protein n=1 Tax=Patellaria atrata CBS 101060 TaxID=1346257 RepID=A0A9P4S738_9PEZI|nr:hypothetical protein M501DRAFT_987551 [Patellaria atrata CBS 101060]